MRKSRRPIDTVGIDFALHPKTNALLQTIYSPLGEKIFLARELGKRLNPIGKTGPASINVAFCLWASSALSLAAQKLTSQSHHLL